MGELQAKYGRDADVRFMSRPGEWPYWPKLPIKRRSRKEGEQIEIGTMLAKEGSLTTVFLCNIFDSPILAEKIEYTDYEAIADDGWIVD